MADRLILVVDDDPLIRASIGVGLEFWGFRVSTAGDGHAALDAIAEEEPAIVLLDMRMPGLDGRGFARELARLGRQIPIILISAEPNLQALARDIGAVAWVVKPFDLGRLFASIDRVLDSSA
jgi:two-component system, OmpR family, response regulator MprA